MHHLFINKTDRERKTSMKAFFGGGYSHRFVLFYFLLSFETNPNKTYSINYIQIRLMNNNGHNIYIISIIKLEEND